MRLEKVLAVVIIVPHLALLIGVAFQIWIVKVVGIVATIVVYSLGVFVALVVGVASYLYRYKK